MAVYFIPAPGLTVSEKLGPQRVDTSRGLVLSVLVVVLEPGKPPCPAAPLKSGAKLSRGPRVWLEHTATYG